jgi:ribosomal protein S18 acetylase RimI-like enzyme
MTWKTPVSEDRIRAATKADCRTIAELYRIASDGVSDYIWTKLAEPGQDLLDVGQRRYEREDTAFSYRNASVVERNGKVIAMLVSFPMVVDEHHVESDPVLAPYSALEEPDSYYICAMAVYPEFRGQRTGQRLLQLAEDKARNHGFSRLSLIVFEKNTGAKRLYERFGYHERARRPVVPHPLIHHEGDAVLMVKDIGTR